MASAKPVDTFVYADITTCPTIVPRNVLAKLGLSARDNNRDLEARVIASANTIIDKDKWLSDQQKADLHNLIKLSPNAKYTAHVIAVCVSPLWTMHNCLSSGFQFFIDGGRGKAELDSTVSTFWETSDDIQ
jgi:hypothetical protein